MPYSPVCAHVLARVARERAPLPTAAACVHTTMEEMYAVIAASSKVPALHGVTTPLGTATSAGRSCTYEYSLWTTPTCQIVGFGLRV